MILSIIFHLMLKADCEQRLSSRWRTFKRDHIVDWDRNDPQTKKYLEDNPEEDDKSE